MSLLIKSKRWHHHVEEKNRSIQLKHLSLDVMEWWGLMIIFRNFPYQWGIQQVSLKERGRACFAQYPMWLPGALAVKKGKWGRCHATLNVVALMCQSSFCTINSDQQHYCAVIHVCDFTITSELFLSDSVFSFLLPHRWETAVCKSCV